MLSKYSEDQYKSFMRLRSEGFSIRESCECVGINFYAGQSWSRGRSKAYCMAKYHNHHEIPERSKDLTAAKAYILGVICGDGYMGRRNSVELGVLDLDFAERFRDAVNMQYGKRVTIAASPRGEFRVMFKSKDIYADLIRYFSKPPMTEDWRVPSEVKSAGLGVRVEFLRGFIDSEGCVNKRSGQVQIQVNNKEGLLEVRELLLSVGVDSSFYTIHNSERNRDYWMISIQPRYARRFLYNVGFGIARKRSALSAIVNDRIVRDLD